MRLLLFDKKLFENKFVEPDKRVKIDTLFLIGNGFDIWQGLNTRYDAFEKYYQEHLDEVLSRLHIQKRVLLDKKGKAILDDKGQPITYSDVELFYGDPYHPRKLPHEFWSDFETSLDKIDDQEINYFFGRNGVKDIRTCANNAQKILKTIFCDWVTSITISEEKPAYDFGENALFINFNYTDTLLKRFGVKEVNEYHVHGQATNRDSIIVGHSTHPELPYGALGMWKDKPRIQGLYYIEEFLYNADKHVEDNYMKIRVFCALHGVRIEDIQKIYVLGLGFGNADLGYIRHLVHTTEGIQENPEGDLNEDELYYLDNIDYEGEKHLNMQYAISHRERVMKAEPISFPECEMLDEMITPYLEDPYYHISREDQMKLETAAVRRRFLKEQIDRNQKIQKEYLRMLNKRFHMGYLTLEEVFLKADEETVEHLHGAEWHISCFSKEDKKKIEAIMVGYGCKKYSLYHSIDECISKFKINVSAAER